jgi:hypothetical protein
MPNDDSKESDTGEAIGIEVDAQCGESQQEVVREPKRRIRTRAERIARYPKQFTESQRAEVLTLKVKGVDTKTIAWKFGVAETTLHNWLSNFDGLLKEMEGLSHFQGLRADILSAAHARLLKFAMKEEKLQEAPLGQIASAMDKVYKQERLERNLSTDNSEVHAFGRVEHVAKEPDR